MKQELRAGLCANLGIFLNNIVGELKRKYFMHVFSFSLSYIPPPCWITSGFLSSPSLNKTGGGGSASCKVVGGSALGCNVGGGVLG